MRAQLAAVLLAWDLVFLLQFRWVWKHHLDPSWPWRLLLIPLAAALLAWGLARAWQRRGRVFWPGFARLSKALAGRRLQAGTAGLCLLAVYLLLTGGHFYSSDSSCRFLTTQSLVERGSLAINYPPGHPPSHAKYGIVHPLLAAPLYMLGRAGQADTPARAKLDEVMVCTLMQLVTAATAAVFFLFLRDYGYPPGISLGAAFIFGLASIAFPYARFYFTGPLNGLFLLLTAWLLLRHRQRGSLGYLGAAGGALALGIANAPMLLVLAGPAVGAYLVWLHWPRPGGRNQTWGQALRAALSFGLPLVAAGAWLLWFNYFRYGSPWITGYESDRGFTNLVYGGEPGFSAPWYWGLHGLLFSSGKSVFLFSPPLILALYAARRFVRRGRPEGMLVLGVALTALLVYANWWAWHGDVSWGPRYLVPVTALALLPMAQALSEWTWRGWFFKASLVLLLAAGLAVQILGTLLPFDFYFANHVGQFFEKHHLVLYVPQFSPIVGQLKMLPQAAHLDYYLFNHHLPVAPWLVFLGLVSGQAAWLGVGAGEEEQGMDKG